jgi:hypothetical protein
VKKQTPINGQSFAQERYERHAGTRDQLEVQMALRVTAAAGRVQRWIKKCKRQNG